MNDSIIDSSVAVKWVLDEDDSELANQKATLRLLAAKKLFLIDLAQAECGNAIVTRHNRNMLSREDASLAWEKFKLIPKTFFPVEQLMNRAVEIALKFGTTTYDALFVAAVEKRDLEGVTADVPLHRKVSTDFPQIKLLKDW
jgi:predicted nucleic acid-binding protein